MLGNQLNIQRSFSKIWLQLRFNINEVSIFCLHLNHIKSEQCCACTDIWRDPTDFKEMRISAYISKHLTDCYKYLQIAHTLILKWRHLFISILNKIIHAWINF